MEVLVIPIKVFDRADRLSPKSKALQPKRELEVHGVTGVKRKYSFSNKTIEILGVPRGQLISINGTRVKSSIAFSFYEDTVDK